MEILFLLLGFVVGLLQFVWTARIAKAPQRAAKALYLLKLPIWVLVMVGAALYSIRAGLFLLAGITLAAVVFLIISRTRS